MRCRTTLRLTRFSWQRPAKFAFVGAIGIGVQLISLHWLVNLGCTYLAATVVAVETTVLHNFVWHEKFTWIDRNQVIAAGLRSRLVRFHFSNGLISIAGNLFLMRMLVGESGLPIIPANLLSITICSVTNFLVSDRWVFARASPAGPGTPMPRPSRDLRLEAACAVQKEHR